MALLIKTCEGSSWDHSWDQLSRQRNTLPSLPAEGRRDSRLSEDPCAERQARYEAWEPATSSLEFYRRTHIICRFFETGPGTHYAAEGGPDFLTLCVDCGCGSFNGVTLMQMNGALPQTRTFPDGFSHCHKGPAKEVPELTSQAAEAGGGAGLLKSED